MTTIHLVVNPAAAAGTAGLHATDIAEILQHDGADVELITTKSPEHAVEVAAVAKPEDIVAPLGGDGMLSLVTRGLVESGALLLPLPAGRGNDFVRSLKLPLDTAAVARGLPTALAQPDTYVRTIDVGYVNDVPFLGVVSMGFDAAANARANKFRRMRGPLVYTAAGALTIATNPRRTYVINTDGDTRTVQAWNLAIGNSGRHGGGQKVCPHASLTDGLLDLVVFGGSRRQFTEAALSMRSGRHVQLGSVTGCRGRTFQISRGNGVDAGNDAQSVPVFADGDRVGVLPVTVRVEPHALRVVCPPVA